MLEISTTATFDRLFEKLPPKHHGVWSFRVDRAYRIVFKFIGDNQAELRSIGHHHSIYDYDLFR